MKAADILIKPILTEKANGQQEKLRRYAFRVDKKANKLEIKRAVENFYGVTVTDVNTVVAPAKSKTRYTKAGFIAGQNSSYKKAFVTIAAGETIDLYSNI
jgi:large subunit ribosomal protein L23